MIVVEVRQKHCGLQLTKRRRTRQEAAEGRRRQAGRRQAGRQEEATNIKSNNPHLAGGEK